MDRMDAGRVIGLLTTAFPTYPVDEATSELYVQALAEKVPDAAIGYAVVQDWIQTRLTFPKVAEMLDECGNETGRRRRRAEAIERGRAGAEGRGMESCSTCHGTRWEESEDPEKPGYLFVLPCRVCESMRHKHWAEGHATVGHNFAACDWVWCQQKAKQGTAKRRQPLAAAKTSGGGADARYEHPEQF